ncbi:hypothetical protein RCL1_000354 [Eukaryota sp. TZLM3-RCL]
MPSDTSIPITVDGSSSKKRSVLETCLALTTSLLNSNFFTLLFILVEFIQFFALVFNNNFRFINSALDVRPFLHFLSFPGYDPRYWSPLTHVHLSFLLPVTAFVLLLLLLTNFVLTHLDKSSDIMIGFTRLLIDLSSTLFFFPLVITGLTWLNCSDSSVFVAVPVASCWTSKTVLIKIIHLSSLVVIVLFSLFRVSVINDLAFNSRRTLACFDRRFLVSIVVIKLWLSVSLTLLDHLPLVFKLSYPCCCFLLVFLLFKWLPFYRLSVNKLFAFLCASLASGSFIWFIFSFNYSSVNSWFVTLTLYFSSFSFGVLSFMLMNRYYLYDAFKLVSLCKSETVYPNPFNKFKVFIYKLISKITRRQISSDFSVELQSLKESQPTQQVFLTVLPNSNTIVAYDSSSDSAVSDTFTSDPVLNVSDNLFDSVVTSPNSIERLLRCAIISKENGTKFNSILSPLFEYSLKKFASNINVFLLKSLYELFITQDAVASVVALKQISTLDLDLSLAQKYAVFTCNNTAEALKREQSIGQSLDSTSFLTLKARLKEVNELHRDCIDHLATFWSGLLSNDSPPDLSFLPLTTERIYETKRAAERAFTKLIHDFPRSNEAVAQYAKFLREVSLDEDIALALEASCSTDTNDRSSVGDRSELLSSNNSGNKVGKLKHRGKITQLLMNNGSSSSSESSINSLRKSSYFSLSILFGVLLFATLLLNNDANSFRNQFNSLFEIQHLGSSSQEIAYSSLLLYSPFTSLPFISELKQNIYSEANHFLYHFRNVLVGYKLSGFTNSSKVCNGDQFPVGVVDSQEILTDPLFPRNTGVSSYFNLPLIQVSNFFRLSHDFCLRAIFVLDNSLSSSYLSLNNNLEFIQTNRETISAAASRLISAVEFDFRNVVDWSIVVSLLSVIISLFIIIIIGVFLFGRALTAIDLMKTSTFNSFLDIPQQVIKHLLRDEKFSHTPVGRKLIKEQFENETDEVVITTLKQKINENDNVLNEELIKKKSSKQEQNIDSINFCGKCYISLFIFFFVILLSFLFLGYVSGTNVLYVHNSAEKTRNLIASKTFLDQTIIESSRSLLEFISSGNLKFYHKYLSHVVTEEMVDFQSNMIELAQSYPFIVSYYSSFSESLESFSFLNSVCLFLSKNSYEYSDYDMPAVATFHYNISQDPQWESIKAEYSLDFWFNDSESDLLLSTDELSNLAVKISTSSYYMDIQQQILGALEKILSEILEDFSTKSNFILQGHNFVYPFVFLTLISCVVLLLVFSLFASFTVRFNSVKIFTILLIITTFFCFSFLLFESYSDSVITPNYIIELNSSVFFLNSFSQLSKSIYSSLYFSNLFVNSGNYWAYRDLVLNINSISNLISEIEDYDFSEEDSHVLSSLPYYNETIEYFKYLDEFFVNYDVPNFKELTLNSASFISEFDYNYSRSISDIAVVLSSLARNIPSILIDQSLDWNFSLEENYTFLKSNFFYFDWDNHYSDRSSDLSLTKQDQSKLASSLLVNDIYKHYVQNVEENLQSSRQSIITSFTEILSNSYGNILSLNLRFGLLLYFSLFVVFSAIVFLFTALKSYKSRIQGNIRQHLTFPLTKSLRFKYIVALIILSILIISFFTIALYSIFSLQPYFSALSYTGERLVRFKEVQVVTVEALITPTPQLLKKLQHQLNYLSSFQQQLLFGTENYEGIVRLVNINKETTALEFNFQMLLNDFITLVTSSLLYPTSPVISTNLVENVHSFGTRLNNAVDELLLRYRNEAINRVNNSHLLLGSLFLVLILLMISEFIIVFRNMIKKLNQVEETVFLLMSMSEDVSNLPVNTITLKTQTKEIQVPASHNAVNIADLCKQFDLEVPSLCFHKSTGAQGTCGLCLVQVKKHGSEQFTMTKSCLTKLEPGLVINVDSPAVQQARLRARARLNARVLKNRPDIDSASLIDNSSVAITIDQTNCISCLRCVSACSSIQSIGVLKKNPELGTVSVSPTGLKLSDSNCISCGNCTLVCSTGAIKENNDVEKVEGFLADEDLITVIQTAPAVRIHFSELLGLPTSSVTDLTVTACRLLGFNYVFDTQITADLTIVEEGTEFLQRLTTNSAPLPMFTSCCPSWINYVEKIAPEFIPNLSSCKSPQAMLGSIIKHYWSTLMNIDPKRIRVVSLMPCTGKKSEISRHQLSADGLADVDAVLTIREFAKWFASKHSNPLEVLKSSLEKNSSMGSFDHPLAASTGGAPIFAKSGGVMISALRFVAFKVAGIVIKNPPLLPHPHLPQVREGSLVVPFNNGHREVKIAVVNGIGGCRKLLQNLKRYNYDFIEVMACPGGCLSGGGSAIVEDVGVALKSRIAAVHKLDTDAEHYRSDQNPEMQTLYTNFLKSPNSHVAHKYLHTTYAPQTTSSSISRLAAAPSTAATTKISADLVVIYGSTNGGTQELASNGASDLEQMGYTVKCFSANEVDPLSLFCTGLPIVFFMSTYFEGEFPCVAQELWSFLSKSLSSSAMFSKVSFAVFGVGDSHFVKFNQAAKSLYSQLSDLGCTPLVPLVLSDVSKHGDTFSQFDHFMESVQIKIVEVCGQPNFARHIAPVANYHVVNNSGKMSLPSPAPMNYFKCPIQSITQLTPSGHEPASYHVVFDLPEDRRYYVGDDISIIPLNSETVVADFLYSLGLNPDQLVTIIANEGFNKYLFPSRITWRQYALEYASLQAPPTRKLCENLSWYCTDVSEKKQLASFGSREGSVELRDWIERGNRTVDLFLEFSSIKIAPEILVSIIPIQRARIYGVASSPSLHPRCCHFIIEQKSFKTSFGREVNGVTSTYISDLHASFYTRPSFSHFLTVAINPGALHLPTDSTAPLIMIAKSTGIAPVLAILQERRRLKEIGQPIGSAILFFQCSSSKDYLMKNELSASLALGTLSSLNVSFSSETECNSVVDTIRESKDFVSMCLEPNFYYYCCGALGELDKQVEALSIELLGSESHVVKAKEEKRWFIESY